MNTVEGEFIINWLYCSCIMSHYEETRMERFLHCLARIKHQRFKPRVFPRRLTDQFACNLAENSTKIFPGRVLLFMITD